jgi:hypothetical protein
MQEYQKVCDQQVRHLWFTIGLRASSGNQLNGHYPYFRFASSTSP